VAKYKIPTAEGTQANHRRAPSKLHDGARLLWRRRRSEKWSTAVKYKMLLGVVYILSYDIGCYFPVLRDIHHHNGERQQHHPHRNFYYRGYSGFPATAIYLMSLLRRSKFKLNYLTICDRLIRQRQLTFTVQKNFQTQGSRKQPLTTPSKPQLKLLKNAGNCR